VLVFASLVTLAPPASAHTGAYMDPLLGCQAYGYSRVMTTTAPNVSATAGTQWVYWRPEFWMWDEYTRQWHLREYGRWGRALATAGSYTNTFYDTQTGANVSFQTHTGVNGTNHWYVVNQIQWWIDGGWHSARPYSQFLSNYACTSTGLGNW
jgi:hypothetical protein